MRDQIENVLLEHVIKYFAKDPNFWPTFSECLLANAKDQKLNLKSTKMSDVLGALKVEIEAIRQSGHRGTSVFNWITNFVLWTCILAADPWVFVGKTPHKDGQRAWIVQKYTCAFSGRKAILRFIFEGDDSILGSTIDLSVFKDRIETLWYKVGFRMKLFSMCLAVLPRLRATTFESSRTGCAPARFFLKSSAHLLRVRGLAPPR